MADERLIALKMTEVPKRYCGEHIRIFDPLAYDFEQRNCKEGLHMIGVALFILVVGNETQEFTMRTGELTEV